MLLLGCFGSSISVSIIISFFVNIARDRIYIHSYMRSAMTTALLTERDHTNSA